MVAGSGCTATAPRTCAALWGVGGGLLATEAMVIATGRAVAKAEIQHQLGPRPTGDFDPIYLMPLTLLVGGGIAYGIGYIVCR